MTINSALTVLWTFLRVGFLQHAPMTTPKTETVMPPGMQITATTKTGTITITAGEEFGRLYTWEGATRSVTMDPRSERWYGSLGLSYPGPGDHWKPHNGITRGVLEEGQQHFRTQREALNWLRKGRGIPWVYRDDGLVVGYDKVLPRKQLNVEVWQILVNGKKPVKLPGSQNDKIRVATVKIDDAPLLKAVFHSDVIKVRELLEQGSDPNIKTSVGNPIIVVAAQKGNSSIVQALLDRHGNPNAESDDGSTALMAAVEAGHVEAARVLLAHNANVNASQQMGLMAGTTPLMLAAMHGNGPLIGLLLEKGADAQAQDGYMGRTAIHDAADEGHTAIVAMLLKHGVPADIRDAFGITPLMQAASSGRVETVKLLIAKGARVNARDDKSRQQAAMAEYFNDAKTLAQMKQSGKLNELHEDGRSVMDWARIGGNKEIIKMLLAAGAKE